MFKFDFFTRNSLKNPLPNFWDLVAFVVLGALALLLAHGFSQLSGPAVNMGESTISLNFSELPYYAGRSVFRMLLAIILALIITFILGALAAKNRIAEKIVIPVIDVLQSLPVLAFLQISVFLAISLFPQQVIGVELTAVVAIFVAQAWNMILSFYQSLKTVPGEYYEMAQIIQLDAWKQFWRIEVPYARPGLLFNIMLSLSASWFAVVEAEVFYVHTTRVYLPGIGSYIKVAQDQGDVYALWAAILVMFLVILSYDQLIFRPIQAWIARYGSMNTQSQQHWLLSLIDKTKWFRKGPLFSVNSALFAWVLRCCNYFLGLLVLWKLGVFLVSISWSFDFHLGNIQSWWIGSTRLFNLMFLGLVSALRILGVLFLCLLIWVPVGILIGSRGRLAKIFQPIIQILAAFPPNALYPLLMYVILYYRLNVELWIFPLIMIGSQWYILFNVIAGMSVIPKEMKMAVKSLHLPKILVWKKLYLPFIMPYLLTGTMTAAGAAWNATIMAELFTWNGTTLYATGLGSYMKQASESGDTLGVAWSVIVMCAMVMLINIFIWQPLYRMVSRRYE